MKNCSYVKAINSAGSFSAPLSLKYTSTSLFLVPSLLSSCSLLACIVLGFVFCFLAPYLAFVLDDLFGSVLFALIAFTFFGLARHLYAKKVVVEFDRKEDLLFVFNEIIKFQDLVKVELLRKIVESKTQEFPFYIAQIRVLTTQGEYYLLSQGSDQSKMLLVAKAISKFVDAPLRIDDTTYRL